MTPTPPLLPSDFEPIELKAPGSTAPNWSPQSFPAGRQACCHRTPCAGLARQ